MAYIRYDTKEQWLAARRLGITSTDVGAIIGSNPWKSAYTLAAQKLGMEPETLMSDRMRWGLLVEQLILKEFERETGRLVVPVGRYGYGLYHHENGYAIASCDALQTTIDGTSGLGTAEAKWVGDRAAVGDDHNWYEGRFPQMYVDQLQWQLECSGFRYGSIVGLVGDRRQLCWRDFERDEDRIGELTDAAVKFRALIDKGEFPSPDGTKATKASIALVHGHVPGKTVKLDRKNWDLFEAIQDCKQSMKEAETDKGGFENLIRDAMGDAEFGELPDGTVIQLKVVNAATPYTKLQAAKA